MAEPKARLIWHNGRFKPWADANIHILSHAVHYGSAVFEGIRAYETPAGPMIFRLADHIDRMLAGARVYRLHAPYGRDALIAACRETVAVNGLAAAYLRPIVLRGLGAMGVHAPDNPIEVAVAAFPWGAYLGEEGLACGVDACVTSWQRPAPNTIPAGVKAAGNYLSGQLISAEAHERGFDEGIGLGADGLISEGAGENLFLVHRGTLYTPPAAAAILAGITRDTVITLAKDLGIPVKEQPLPREMLYMAEEMFFTGTAAEITPVRSVDRIDVGNGEWPVTRALQTAFFALFDGSRRDERGWLTPVGEEAMVVAVSQRERAAASA